MAELFERHDRSKFEIIGFSFGPDGADEMSARVSAAMDRFLNVRTIPDGEVAQLSRKLGVDIAVDLKGFTGTAVRNLCRTRRTYPGQLPRLSRHHGRRVHRLPDCGQYPDSGEQPALLYGEYRLFAGLLSGQRFQACISSKPCTREGERLPESAFVFCCFNRSYKITPEVFNIWMRIVGQVEGSVLWFLQDNPWSPKLQGSRTAWDRS